VLSIRTVESHLRNIRRKSGAVEREDIASFAVTV
jgi:DNA-binding CsgD family transcriptional regulator